MATTGCHGYAAPCTFCKKINIAPETSFSHRSKKTPVLTGQLSKKWRRRLLADETAPHGANDAWLSGVHARIREAVGPKTSFRSVAAQTSVNAETVRRQMTVQAPSVRFLAAVADTYMVDLNWLLNGTVPPRLSTLAFVTREQLTVGQVLEELGRRFDAANLPEMTANPEIPSPHGEVRSIAIASERASMGRQQA